MPSARPSTGGASMPSSRCWNEARSISTSTGEPSASNETSFARTTVRVVSGEVPSTPRWERVRPFTITRLAP